MLENFGDEENVIKTKGNTKGEEAKKSHGQLVGSLKAVAEMQGRIDTALAAGAITKDERKNLMKNFIEPITSYVEANAEQFDEGSWFGGINKFNKLGYDKIKKQFDTKDLTGEELLDVQKQKLFAQNYYLDELNIAAKKLGMGSIYEIEGLAQRYQQEIYKTASENALKKAQRWTDSPEYFFAKEFPEEYSEPFKMFGQEKALMINRVVAEEVYKEKFNGADARKLKDIANSKMFEEMRKEVKYQQVQAAGILLNENYNTNLKYPKTYNELVEELEKYGYTDKDFVTFAEENGYVKRGKDDWWKGRLSKGYMAALSDLRKLKTMGNN